MNDKIRYIILFVMLCLIVIVLPIWGLVIVITKYIKIKKRLKELEREHIKYVSTVKRIYKHESSDEYNDNIVYVVDVNGREIECMQHTGVCAELCWKDGWIPRHNRFIRLENGEIPSNLPKNKIITKIDYAAVGTKINVYSFDGKYVTDVDERHLVDIYVPLFVILVGALACSCMIMKGVFENGFFDLLQR